MTTTTHRFPALCLVSFLALALFSACSPVRVSQDFVQTADFAAIHSYGWRETMPAANTDPRVTNPLLRQRFHDAIEETLNQRGYRQAAQPDVLVDYTYAIISRLDTDQFDSRFGLGFGRDPGFGGFWGMGPIVRQYDVSLLLIDIYDTSGKHLLWRGSGSEILTTYKNPAELTAAVNRMVTAILAQFPPSANSLHTAKQPDKRP